MCDSDWSCTHSAEYLGFDPHHSGTWILMHPPSMVHGSESRGVLDLSQAFFCVDKWGVVLVLNLSQSSEVVCCVDISLWSQLILHRKASEETLQVHWTSANILDPFRLDFKLG